MKNKTQTKALMPYAIAVGERMANEYLLKGDYFPKTSWGCEGQIYPSQMGVALLELYKTEKNQLFLDGVKAVIESNIRKQLPSGGWALMLGATGNGTKFEVTPHLVQLTADIEDLPPTVTALRLMADYRLFTGDASYDVAMKKGYEYLVKFWNEEEGAFDEMLVGEALKLRAKPKDYHIYSYQCIFSLSKIYPEAKQYVAPLYESAKEVFEEMNPFTYPLLHAMYAALIIETEGKSDYVTEKVKKRVAEDITFKSHFLIKEAPGALGHHDGLRGIHLDEGHIRNSVGAALAMRFYDEHVEAGTFTNSDFYRDVTNWIISMYDGNGLFYEFVDIKSGERMGVGTPSQFLSVFWILGIF